MSELVSLADCFEHPNCGHAANRFTVTRVDPADPEPRIICRLCFEATIDRDRQVWLESIPLEQGIIKKVLGIMVSFSLQDIMVIGYCVMCDRDCPVRMNVDLSMAICDSCRRQRYYIVRIVYPFVL